MHAPFIGVTTSVTVDKYPERTYINGAYLAAVQLAGGVPLLLPPQLESAARDRLFDRLDGLMLTGGGDIDPVHFGEPRHPSASEISDLRDALELALTERAVDRKLPVLAICRGIQILNVTLGGTLYQDIPGERESPINHNQKEPRDQPTHPVKLTAEGTRLGGILGSSELAVNSFHHQAIKRLGRGLREVAQAPDGIVEAVEMPDEPFVIGVQWHPEDLVEHDSAARSLFAAFVDAAKR